MDGKYKIKLNKKLFGWSVGMQHYEVEEIVWYFGKYTYLAKQIDSRLYAPVFIGTISWTSSNEQFKNSLKICRETRILFLQRQFSVGFFKCLWAPQMKFIHLAETSSLSLSNKARTLAATAEVGEECVFCDLGGLKLICLNEV